MKKVCSYNFFHYIQKTSETTYYQRNRNLILGRAKRYYENDKERLRDKARDKYKELSKEEKIYKKKI